MRILGIWLALLCLAAAGVAQPPEVAPCTVCTAEGKSHGDEPVAASYEYQGTTYYFCHQGCKDRFVADPSAFLKPASNRANFGQLGPWTVVDSAGSSLSSTDYQGKVLIIDLWATWCGPCVQEIPQFMELQKQKADAGLAVLGISFDNDEAAHTNFLRDEKLNYPSALASEEGTRHLLKQIGSRVGAIKAIPLTLVIDRQGTIIYRKVGVIDAEFEQAVQAALEAR